MSRPHRISIRLSDEELDELVALKKKHGSNDTVALFLVKQTLAQSQAGVANHAEREVRE